MAIVHMCSACGQEYSMDLGECPHCAPDIAEEMSVADDIFEQLVEEASVPNLAALFRKAKSTGAISATGKEYGEST